MKKILLSAIISIGIFTNSEADAIAMFGTADCGEWVKANTPQRKSWLMGYLSGLNSALSDSKTNLDPLNELSSASQAYLWMDNYCKDNPLSAVPEAANTLFLELLARAKKK